MSKIIWSTRMNFDNLLALDRDSLVNALIDAGYDEEMINRLSIDKLHEIVYGEAEDLLNIEIEDFNETILPEINKQCYKGIIIIKNKNNGKACYAEDIIKGDKNCDDIALAAKEDGTLTLKEIYPTSSVYYDVLTIPSDKESIKSFIINCMPAAVEEELSLLTGDDISIGEAEEKDLEDAIYNVDMDMDPRYINNYCDFDTVAEYTIPVKYNGSLTEAIPSDLVNAYKKVTNIGANGSVDFRHGYQNIKSSKINFNQPGVLDRAKVDFQNSTYTEITPDEAIQLKKNDKEKFKKLRVIFDGQLITFDDEGDAIFQAEKHNWDSATNQKYTKPNGDMVDTSRKLTTNTILRNADKIYLADEIMIDDLPDDIKNRPNNIDSRYAKINNFDGIAGIMRKEHTNSFNTYNNNIHSVETELLNKIKRDKKNLEILEHKVIELQLEINETDPNDTSKFYKLKRDLNRTEEQIEDYKNDLITSRIEYNNYRRAINNAVPNLDLNKNIFKFKQLKKNIEDMSSDIYMAERKLERTKIEGDPKVAEAKRDIQKIKDQILAYQKKLASLELEIFGMPDVDQAAVDLAQSKLDELINKKSDLQNQINQLKTRTSTTESLVTEAKSKDPDKLDDETAEIKFNFEEFGPEGFYSKSFDSFENEFPEFTKAVIKTFLKEMELATPEQLSDRAYLNANWKNRGLIDDKDWPALIDGAQQMTSNRKDKGVHWEKIYKKYYKSYDA